jgi:hypothetical protein
MGANRMAETIQKPDANPALAALLAVFFDLGHIVVNGQQRKWVVTTLLVHAGFVLCCVPGIVLRILSVIDAYQTAERLMAGESLSENEYTLPALFKIVKLVDATATCAGA